MNDPKNRPLLYLVIGVVAIVTGIWFILLPSSNIIDWLILGMGVVSVFKGVQEYWQNGGLIGRRKKNGTSAPGAGAPDDKA